MEHGARRLIGDWKPIKTVPVEIIDSGDEILIYSKTNGVQRAYVGWIEDDGTPVWLYADWIKMDSPTHWMSLPEIPK